MLTNPGQTIVATVFPYCLVLFISNEAVLYKSEFGTMSLGIWFAHAASARLYRVSTCSDRNCNLADFLHSKKSMGTRKLGKNKLFVSFDKDYSLKMLEFLVTLLTLKRHNRFCT